MNQQPRLFSTQESPPVTYSNTEADTATSSPPPSVVTVTTFTFPPFYTYSAVFVFASTRSAVVSPNTTQSSSLSTLQHPHTLCCSAFLPTASLARFLSLNPPVATPRVNDDPHTLSPDNSEPSASSQQHSRPFSPYPPVLRTHIRSNALFPPHSSHHSLTPTPTNPHAPLLDTALYHRQQLRLWATPLPRAQRRRIFLHSIILLSTIIDTRKIFTVLLGSRVLLLLPLPTLVHLHSKGPLHTHNRRSKRRRNNRCRCRYLLSLFSHH